MKRLIAFSLFALFSAGILAGCNTVDGAGKDVEAGGEAVQDAAS
ncbi:entericidin A/B family lipoprotein [Salinicola sp. LHM]|jgi:predicted small secreted protein|uniref:Entericidin A/B family lipoprotein n=1 Tax=Salinicola corii TaxID=2606937 RepID=A0A640WGY4_9GAMM|nr:MULTISPECIES: entericidin A/B family lipoprotein [Salinicola]KAA0019604.1 entericidin A/B family lipoprotein [Salinicola corii]MAM59786.1 entericidin, EcnA/B family [Salinicola sp.]MDF3919688.1 entericidin A/B family lipoprotein [Salinicola salarius]NRB57010.1 entericidin A/B family lipoprotein [Salinicola sp.]OHY98288.1 entericidin [Salinicola sp. MIT1003]|tara:strand:- start:455 stop:586 length:132 start_codon:yes stop_codon:yes gene_type:complete